MIVRDHLPLRRLWPNLYKRLALLFLFDLSIALLFSVAGVQWVSMPGLPLAMMGAALSLFLAFRNNSAYGRWWEARGLWGSVINTARTWSRQVLTLVDTCGAASQQDEAKRFLVELQIAYVHVLRCHLRRQNPFPELENTLPADVVAHLRHQKNVPTAILMIMAERLRTLFDKGCIDSFRFAALDNTLTEWSNVQGACERIKNTPLPRQYNYFPRLMVGVYTVLLPLGLVGSMGLLTPLASTMLSAVFLCLDHVGREIENPFENTVHDMPMSQITRMLEINLRQNLGDNHLPPEVRPVEGFVY